MRIAHFGTFDVANFGDLLFPLVLERRLAGRGHSVTHVSPVGGPPVFGDCVETISVASAMQREFDGVVIGGGHLIHGRATDLPAYRAAGDGALFAYSDLWFGATRLACRQGASIVWNAPGVPGAFAPETSALVGWAARQADYLALRDETSRRFLDEALGAGAERERVDAQVVLDTAIDVAGLWSEAELDLAFRGAFESRGSSPPGRALAVHFNTRFLPEGIETTSARLAAICRLHSLCPILLALGPCHGDDELVRELSAALGRLDLPHLAIDCPASLRELVACLRGAEVYVGSSLHGGVTARSFDRAAVLVAREAPEGHRKHRSFLAAHASALPSRAGALSTLVATWEQAFDALDSILALPGEAVPAALRNAARDASSRGARIGAHRDVNAVHWSALLAALESDRARIRERRAQGAAALAALENERWSALGAVVGILLDQAREAAAHRESAQRNAERFRRLERAHRDLRDTLRSDARAPARASRSVAAVGSGAEPS